MADYSSFSKRSFLIMNVFRIVATALLCLASPTLTASGGDGGYEVNRYDPEHYVTKADMPMYAAGNLGVVQPGYWRVYLLIAYLAVEGHPLSPTELSSLQIEDWHIGAVKGAGWGSMDEPSENGIGTWKEARKTVDGTSDLVYSLNPMRYGNFHNYFPNCGKDAFDRAAATLADRKKRGNQAALLRWVAAQDAVFANCSPVHYNGADASTFLPEEPGISDPLWLQQDYQYQRAAALFYAEEYDAARTAFLAIAEDKTSPWQPLGRYLAARCLIRKATTPAESSPLNSDVYTRQKSEQRALLLQSRAEMLDASKEFSPSRSLVDWIDARAQPMQRLSDIEQAFTSTERRSPKLPQQVADYLLILDQTLDRYQPDPSLSPSSPMATWIVAMQGNSPIGQLTLPPQPKPEIRREAIRKTIVLEARRRRKKGNSTLWLMPLITNARAGDLTEEERAAAMAVSSKSPAFLTIRYQLARIALQEGKADFADTLIDAVLDAEGPTLATASRNRWLGLKLLSAHSLAAFLAAAPRVVVDQPRAPIPDQSPPATALRGIDHDFDVRLYRDFPLSMLVEIRNDPALPADYASRLPEILWVRANITGDYTLADSLAVDYLFKDPELLAEYKTAKTVEIRKQVFARVLLTSSTSLQPATRGDHGESYAWGCPSDYQVEERVDTVATGDLAKLIPYFLQPVHEAVVKEQTQRLALPELSGVIGPALLDWARANPDHPDVPEELHQLVGMTRMECRAATGPSKLHVSRDAFQLLHKRYPHSEWTKKTPYYF